MECIAKHHATTAMKSTKKDNQRLQFEEGHIIHWQKRTKLSLLSFNTNLQDEKSLNAMF